MMKKIYAIGIILLWCVVCFGQESKLANQYYQTGEYEKAAYLYKKLFEQAQFNDYYFNRYIESLMALEEFDQCERIIQKEIENRPHSVHLYVLLGNVFEQQNMADKAEEQYNQAIYQLSPHQNVIASLGNSFIRLAKYDLALRAYEIGEAIMDQEGIFSYNIADIYRRKGDVPNMIRYYLLSIRDNPDRVASMKNFFNRNLYEEDYMELRTQLFELIQSNPENISFPELLEWVYIQEKEYTKALRQATALDRRLSENGERVYNLASIAANDRDYDTAIQAYEYILREKGMNSSYYFEAKQEILNCKKRKIIYQPDYTYEDLLDLKMEYRRYLGDIGRNKQSAYILAELANLQAYYLNELDSAIFLLNEMIEFPGVNKYLKANAKLSLADFYLMGGEIWESTLLYSQVDKEFREEYLGEKARFQNARLSYFNGDFQWAQSQFDVLKASTSKLISNDAIDMSVFIMDNLGLDTTDRPLQLYANAELLILQNKFEEAFNKLDTLSVEYQDHSLLDDIYYAKAQIYSRQRNFDLAIHMYERIIENHQEEIRCDNAIFELANLYENELNDPDKASELYEKLFIDFSNSTYSIEARKRYRRIRGDLVQ